MTDRLTLVIPTYQRPPFVERALRYYAGQRVTFPIVIADSSPPPASDLTQRVVETWRTSLRVRYERSDPQIHVAQKIARALDGVETPYAALGADDDFSIPAALEQSVEFLALHPDYALAHGEAVLLTLTPATAVYGRCAGAAAYLQRAIELPTGAQRLLEHLRAYSVIFYAVHRTELLRANWHITAAGALDFAFVELLPSCLAVIQGKRQQLGGLFLVRQAHAAQTSVNHLLDPFDWITDPRWAAQQAYVRDALTEALMRQDGLSRSEAAEVLKQAFWGYLARSLWRKWRGRYDRRTGGGPGPRWREAVQRIPGLRRTWRAVRSRLPGQACSLESLRRPSSRYYPAFLPINEVLTDSR